MGKRQRVWAQKKRAALVAALGGRCAKCGTDDEDKLEIDHLFRRDWDVVKAGSTWRISIYYKELKNGLIQLLCSKCNSRKGQPPTLPIQPNDNEPF